MCRGGEVSIDSFFRLDLPAARDGTDGQAADQTREQPGLEDVHRETVPRLSAPTRKRLKGAARAKESRQRSR
jgi:hypothetical protein